jgi:uncharacterized protein (TIGR00730 family)
MKRLCVFCGSSSGDRQVYADDARRLGRTLARAEITLVFGAGHVGLMGILADAVLAEGGRAIGVIPRSLMERELAHQRLTELHVVESMHARKALMAEHADAFAALPGGVGTADELFEIITWAQLGLHARPIALLNTAGYFDRLLDWIDHMVAEGFLRPRERRVVRVADTPEQLLDLLGLAGPKNG